MTVALEESHILVVDDESANVRLVTRLLTRWGMSNVRGLTDPMGVIQELDVQLPDLVILDLGMPEPGGLGVIRMLEPWTGQAAPVPILVLTGDCSLEAKREALAAGASDFLTKPFDAEELRLRVANLLKTRSLELELVSHNDVLEKRVRSRTQALERANLEMIERLAIAAEYRDDDTHHHAQRIGNAAATLGEAVGLPVDVVRDLRRAAPLHDIGKIAIPDAVLLKPGRLTTDEFDLIKTHTVAGARILSDSESSLLQMAETIALSHHERWDGRGYPHELAGEEIPLLGRIVAVADVYDALTHRRPYKEPWTTEAALQEIAKSSASHFDPDLVDAFMTLDALELASPSREALQGARIDYLDLGTERSGVGTADPVSRAGSCDGRGR